MIRGPIRGSQAGGKLHKTLYVIYSGQGTLFLVSLGVFFFSFFGCFDARMRLIRQWRREILGSIRGILGWLGDREGNIERLECDLNSRVFVCSNAVIQKRERSTAALIITDWVLMYDSHLQTTIRWM